MTRPTACCAGAAWIAAVSILVHLSALSVPNPTAVDAMERFLARPAGAHQYQGSRRLEASGSGQRGWLDVQTSFTSVSGLEYEVTAEGGSGYIRNRVLRSLLEAERRLIAHGRATGVSISAENYWFHPEEINEEGLAVVRLEPRRKDRSLVRGQMFLTTVEGDLVRVEGALAKNPSFWVRRVHVVRSYRRIDGALMPVALETTAQLRLLGPSALRMTYRYSHIDERPVSEDDRP